MRRTSRRYVLKCVLRGEVLVPFCVDEDEPRPKVGSRPREDRFQRDMDVLMEQIANRYFGEHDICPSRSSRQVRLREGDHLRRVAAAEGRTRVERHVQVTLDFHYAPGRSVDRP